MENPWRWVLRTCHPQQLEDASFSYQRSACLAWCINNTEKQLGLIQAFWRIWWPQKRRSVSREYPLTLKPWRLLFKQFLRLWQQRRSKQSAKSRAVVVHVSGPLQPKRWHDPLPRRRGEGRKNLLWPQPKKNDIRTRSAAIQKERANTNAVAHFQTTDQWGQ